MGGSNQSLFLIAALFAGQGDIIGQGSAAVPLLVCGLLLAFAAAPGWTELVLIWPNRVGGIAASCTEAFRPYSAILSALTGCCYWWGWVPTCGLTALLSASAIHSWYLPELPIEGIAIALMCGCVGANLLGLRVVSRIAIPVATASASLAFLSAFVPIVSGEVDWQKATDFTLTVPFEGWFGGITSLMAGLYLIGFAAPAFEAAACHVGENIDPVRTVPRAMLASAMMAGVYFALLPVVWLGVLGPDPLGRDLALELGPTFAPLFGPAAKAAAIWFMMFNMFHGTLQPLAGSSRTLAQLAEDGILPRSLAWRNRADAPWVATILTALAAVAFLSLGDPVWLIAAANFTYLIGICLPNVAVWLLRRNAPELERPYRAPRGTVGLGLSAAIVWGISALLGFEQFGLPTVIFGLAMAYGGAGLYAWRKWDDRRRRGMAGLPRSLHLKLTGAMVAVILLDGAGYFIAVQNIPPEQTALVTALEDIFVMVAMLTVTVGLVLPGMIAHAADEVSQAARRLVEGTVSDFCRAMDALGRGDLDAAEAKIDVTPVLVHSRDEVGAMADNFNVLQSEIKRAARGLGEAREGLRTARADLIAANALLELRIAETTQLADQLFRAKEAAEAASAAKDRLLAKVSHEIRTPLNGIISTTELLLTRNLGDRQRRLISIIHRSGENLLGVINEILDLTRLEAGKLQFESVAFDLLSLIEDSADVFAELAAAKNLQLITKLPPRADAWVEGDPTRLRQVMNNLLSNAIKFTETGDVTIELSVARETATGLDAVLTVADTGIGIPYNEKSRIFEAFSQVDETSSRKYGGTGLGLAIVQQIVEQVGGRIEVETEVGAGSCFRLEFSLAKVERPLDSEFLPELDGISALVIGGGKTAQALCSQIEQWRGSVNWSRNGADALAELTGANHYDVIIAASRLTDMTGVALIERLRTCNIAGESRLIIVSSVAEPKDREALERLSISHWQYLPARRSELHRCLVGGPATAEPEVAEAVTSQARWASPRRVLLVEDNPVNQEVTANSIAYLGHEVEVVTSGQDALSAFRQRKYDVILMDCHMPGMDGFAATRAVRAIEAANPDREPTPIIALSANVAQGDKDRCIASGMDDHLGKPFQLARLEAVLAHWIGDDEAPALGGRESDHREVPVMSADKSHPIIDETALEQIAFLQRPGSPNILERTIRAFSETTPVLLDSLDKALSANTASDACEYAHSLKSSSANVGAAQLSRFARDLEYAAMAEDFVQARDILAAIRQQYGEVQACLEDYVRKASRSEESDDC